MRLPLVVLLAASTVIPNVQAAEPMRVYTARSIITMDEFLPRARTVAVADGRILAVAELETMGAWLAAREHEIDRRFADKVLVPGLIDNHLHPLMAPEERITVGQALRAVTIDAAFALRMEREIGSIVGASGPTSRCWKRTRSRWIP